MSQPRIRGIFSLLGAVALVAALAGPGQAQLFEAYDNFDGGPLIDPEKWRAATSEGNFGQPTDEFLRVLDGGQLRLALVSYGNDTSDSGVISSYQGLRMRDLGTAGGSRFIIAMKVAVTVLQAELQDCPANPSTDSTRARARLIGAFFNDGTSGGPTDQTGNILGLLQLQKDADGVNRVSATLVRCLAADCSTSEIPTIPGNSASFTTQWSLNTPLGLKLVWQKASHKFKFTVTAAGVPETQVIDYSGILDDSDPPISDFKDVRVHNTVENCNGARKRALMEAHFDNVKVKRDP